MSASDVTRSAGRGGLAISAAKVYFILLGLAQQVVLPRVLGMGGYGALSSVMSPASIVYNPLVTTSIQGVSRAVAQSTDEERPATVRRVLRVHALLTLPIALGFFLCAPLIAAWTNAPHLLGGLRVLSGVVLLYGVYAPLIGVLNGTQRFLGQATLDMLAATLRTAALIAGGWWAIRTSGTGAGVVGASGGFVVAAAVVFAVALVRVGTGKAGPGGPSVGAHLAFIAPLALGQVLLNLLLQADVTFLRKFAGEAALASGLPPTAADPLVGAYRYTQLFSFLPYQLLIAVTFILFPMLAAAHKAGDRDAVARYVRTGVRLALVLMGLMVSVTSGLSGPLLGLVYGKEAAEVGARSMQLLTLGFGAFAIFGILVTVLNSLGRERSSTLVTGVAAALVAVLCYARVQGSTLGPEMLWRTAMATSTSLALATLVAAVLVKRAAGAVVSPLSVVRVVASLAVATMIGRALPHAGKLATLVFAAVVGGAYLVLLIVLRELGRADMETVRTVLSRRRPASVGG